MGPTSIPLVVFALIATAAREAGLIDYAAGPNLGPIMGKFIGGIVAGLYAWGFLKRPTDNENKPQSPP